MNEWNPMMADYNDPYFNRYSQGVGRNLLSGNRTAAHIFVDNFPVEVGEEGLRNIFSDFGFVQSAELKPSKRPDKRHTFGFVVMADPASAAEAISVLNGHRFHFSPLALRVMPAITTEEKDRRKMSKKIERDIMGPYTDCDSFSLSDDARSRRSLEYGRPNLQRSLLGPYNGQNANMQYGPGWAFGNTGSMAHFGRGAPLDDQFRVQGARFMGRGQKLLDYASRDPGRGRGLLSLPGSRAPPRVSQAGSRKQCVQCGQEGSANRCSRCKMYYCSLECQRKDWPNHKNICLDVSLHHQTLYGVDPLASSFEKRRENQSGAPGAYFGAKSVQKDNIICKDKDTMGERNQTRRKEESGQKNQSSARMNENRSKPDTKDQSLESASFNAKNKENGGQRQNLQSARNDAKNRGDSERSQPAENNQSSKNLDDLKNRDTIDSPKKRFNKGKNQSKDDRQGDKKGGEMTKESEAVIPDSKAFNGKEDVHKGSDKSHEKMNGERRKMEKVSQEKKPGKTNVVDESGDAPCQLERDTLPFNSEVECYLSFYKNPDMFWVIKKENMIPFLEATQFFTECIRDVPQISLGKVKAGDLCCLLYMGEWSRAKVNKVQGTKVTVVFLDYGNIDVVEMSDLRPLVPEMLQLPAQAIFCCLSGMKSKQSSLSEEVSAAMSEWFGEPLTKEFRVTCCAKEGAKFAVEVKCDSATPNSLKELHSTGNLASTSEPVKADVNQNVGKKKDPVKRFQGHELQSIGSELNVGDKVYINIMVFKSVEHFVGQVLDTSTTLPELEEMLANMKLEKDAPYRPVVGEVVLAKFHEDSRWYRSEVTDINGDTFNIIFIDYGNEESVSSGDIRQIQDASILKFPRFAVSFGIQGFDEVNLSKNVLDEFAALLEEYTMQIGVWKVVVLEKRKSVVLVDFLSDKKGESLSKAFYKKLSPKKDSPQRATNTSTSDVSTTSPKGPVKSASPDKLKALESTTSQTSCPIQTESLPDSNTSNTSVTVLYVVDLTNFYVGLSDKQVSLTEMMLELNQNIDSLVSMEKVQKGSLATVLFEDGLWYRVQVLCVDDATCSVFFVDYGNTETLKTKDLHVLPDLESTIPAQAIHCSLDVKLDQDKADVLKQLKSLENAEVHARVLRKVKNVCMLQMCKPDGSLLFQTQKQADVQTKKISATAPPMLSDIGVKEQTGTDINVICAYFKDVNEFYCLKVEDIPGVTELSENLESHFKSSGVDMSQKTVVGGVYACHFENQWYRCVVEEIKGNEVHVKYIDFGNSEFRNIADLKPLDHEFLKQPISVLKCKLHGIQIFDGNTNGQELAEYNIMLMKQLQANELHVDIKSKEGDTYLISLSISSKNGHSVDIASDLVRIDFAKWIDDAKSPQQKSEVPDGAAAAEEDEDDDEDEDDRKMRELMRQMEEIKLKKKNKTAK